MLGIADICPSAVQGVSAYAGVCRHTPVPFQPAGQAKLGVSLTTLNATATPANVYATPAGTRFTFATRPYGIYRRHSVNVSAPYSLAIQLPGQVCSAASDGQYLYVAYCGQPFLAYVTLAMPTYQSRILIGQNTPGYLEGFRTVAQFQTNLSIAMDPSDATRIYVLDTLNQVLREVVLDYPGSYLTKSFLLYGKRGSSYQPGNLANPTSIHPVAPGYLLFADTNSLWQLYTSTGEVTQALTWSDYPALPAQPPLNYTLSADFTTLTLVYPDLAATFRAATAPCLPSTSSLPGSDCAISCGPNTYVTSAGACLPCTVRTCQAGQALVACTNNSDTLCLPCPPLTNISGFKRIYTGPAQSLDTCDQATWSFLAPCPIGYYLSGQYCSECPAYSYTLYPGARSIQECRCPGSFPLSNTTYTCTITLTSIFPLPSPSKCPFGTYNRGAGAACVSCRLTPCPRCTAGQYPTTNCSCSACFIIPHAHATGPGLLDSPASCGFECDVGYFLLLETTVSPLQCLPCTNLPGPGWIYVSNGVIGLQSSCQTACAPGYRALFANCVPV